MQPPASTKAAHVHWLADPRLRAQLSAMVRRRVPESEAEDVVQATLAEAVASTSAPDEPEAFRRWVWGVARHKIVDWHRRARRETPGGATSDLEEDAPPPTGENEGDDGAAGRDLLRWAEAELPPGSDARRTLGWMLREGEGEKLESIAESEAMPAPRVRQRVARLRRHLRTRWALEVAALAALGLVIAALVAYALVRRRPRSDVANGGRHENVAPDRAPTPAPTAPPVAPATSSAAPLAAPSASIAPTASSAPAPRTAPTDAVPRATSAPLSTSLGPAPTATTTATAPTAPPRSNRGSTTGLSAPSKP